MITDFNDSAVYLSSGCDSKHATKLARRESNTSKPSATKATRMGNDHVKTRSDGLPPNKKSVRFDSNISCNLHSSEISPGEKRAAWYNASDLDRFKREAAQEAGVKLVRCDEGNKFVMLGDFDGRTNAGDTVGASNNVDKKAHYNENEYADSGGICRRGLGCHFSRSRKSSRAVCRSAVVSWQKTLRGELGNDVDLEKICMTLALVSAKCSRTAREEAKWRGEVDYMVAHPERRADTVKSASGADEKDGSARVGSGPIVAPRPDVAGRTRQRSGGSCRGVGDGLVSAPVRRILQRAYTAG